MVSRTRYGWIIWVEETAWRNSEPSTKGNLTLNGISEATFYNWKAKYGGMGVTDVQKLKRLEDENAKLKRVVADLTLDNVVLKDLLSKNF
jgi:putative transposase